MTRRDVDDLLTAAVEASECGDSDGAIADYTAVIALPDAPVDLVAQALNDRGIAKGERGDRDGEIADYVAAIDMPNAPANVVELARTNLAETVPAPKRNK